MSSLRVVITAARDAATRPAWGDDPPVVMPCSLATAQTYNLLDGFAIIEEAADMLAAVLLRTEPSPPLDAAAIAHARLARVFLRVLQAASLAIHQSISVQHLGWIAQDPALAAHVLARAARHSGWPEEAAAHPSAGAWPWEELAAYLRPVLLGWGRHRAEDVPSRSWRQALEAARQGRALHLELADDLLDGRIAAQVAVRLLVAATAAWVARTPRAPGDAPCALSIEPAGIVTSRWSPVLEPAALSLVARWHGIGVPRWANGGCWAWRTVPFPAPFPTGDAPLLCPAPGPGLFYAERVRGHWRCVRSRRAL